MAYLAAKEYASVHIDVCYCSPLKRAAETAEIFVGDRNIPIIKDDRLMEMCFGEYEGMERSFDIPDCPVNRMFTEPEKCVESIGGGETFDELYARTGEFLREVIEPQLAAGKDVLIVGHGAMNSSIICQRRGLPREQFWSAGLEQCKLLTL